MQKNLIISIVIILLAVFIGYSIMIKNGREEVTPPQSSENTEGQSCTQEAKMCPDGSFVARVAPSCEFAVCSTVEVSTPPTNPPQKTAETQCKEDGGSWEQGGTLGAYYCVHRYSDAGKICTSSSQCMGGCIVTNQNQGVSSCKTNDNQFGCYQSIEDKNAGKPMLCRD